MRFFFAIKVDYKILIKRRKPSHNSSGFVVAVSRTINPALNGTDYKSVNTMALTISFEKEFEEDFKSSFFFDGFINYFIAAVRVFIFFIEEVKVFKVHLNRS